MKLKVLTIILLLILNSCKQEKASVVSNNKEAPVTQQDVIEKASFDEKSEEKVKQLEHILNSEKPKQLVHDKYIYEENNKTILDFHYPVLNSKINVNYSNFNSYVDNELVNKTIALMRENEEYITLCDTIKTRKQRSVINYSIKENKQILSTVFAIENFYANAMHSNLSFKTINYDFDKEKIVWFKDYFKPETELDILRLLNKIITTNINSGEMYYDCWEISPKDFNAYKDNFVINNDVVQFYFDDCVVCPSYTGTYYIEATKAQIKTFIKDTYLIEKNFENEL